MTGFSSAPLPGPFGGEVSNVDVVDDLVMWDNPTALHSASPISAATGPDDSRLIYRISLKGTPTLFA